ncbi:Heterokaryon incompatibility protein 6,OR allele [Lachnellula willkommii]|uniref:Heterokaryon incompatibility protein 6,OR allele n=1 Tax=Lachnellula willkommii TaxID=215461 RepID=A0A559MM07_9HELO|nr:Heterokaryon incompatibility protein 6,OR allele [Lachnellula willkommii]
MAATYEYSRFSDTNSIRLIFLDQAANVDDSLRCQLRTVNLDDDDLPEFEAISYAWGEPIFSQQLLVDGQRLDITLSLFGALQRVRLPTAVRVLWADAACINQQDINERSQQVQLMRKIYRGASRVLVWLGPGGPEVPVAVKLIDKMNVLFEEELARTDDLKLEPVSAELNAMWGLPAFDSPDSTIQVYRDITHYVIETHLNLDILSLVGFGYLPVETIDFPSWVPRFDGRRPQRFSRSFQKTSNNLPLFFLPSLDEDALILRGISFDSLSSGGRQSLQRRIESSEMFESMWNNIAQEAIAYSEGKVRLWALYMTMTAGNTLYLESAENDARHLADIWAYEKQLSEEAKVRRRKPSDRIELWGEEIYAANPTGSATRFKQAVTVLSSDLVLFTTAKGYIGLGPSSMLAGDGSHWQFVGACYVHGIMQGEALKDFNGDMSQTEIFEIR